MIARARRVLPGMVMSVMLSAPALVAAKPAMAEDLPAQPAARSAQPARKAVRPALRRVSAHPRDLAGDEAYRNAVALAPRMSADGLPIRELAGMAAVPVAAPQAEQWSDESGQWRQVGVASWYGGARWQGRRTTSGDRYDEAALTAAHATLPIGSHVRVTNASSGRSVVVTINDRPGTRRRIIDLSRAAAAELGMINSGIATVTLTQVSMR